MPFPIIFAVGQALGFLARRAALLFAKKAVKKSATKSITKNALKGLSKKTGKVVGVSALKKSTSQLLPKAEKDIDQESSKLKSSIEKEDADAIPVENDQEKVVAESEPDKLDAVKETSTLSQKEPITGSKTDLLNRILSETFILRKTIKSIEELYYQREQDIEAKAIERKSEEKDAEKIDRPRKKDKTDVRNKRLSAITAIAKAFLGVLITFGPILVKLFNDNKEMIMSLPSLLKEKFLKIGESLSTAVDEYLIQPIKELFTVTLPELFNTLMETAKQFIDNLMTVPIRLFNSMNEYSKQLQVKALSTLYDVAGKIPMIGEKVQASIAPYLENKKKELQTVREKNKKLSAQKPKKPAAPSRKPSTSAAPVAPSAAPASSVSNAIGASEAGGSYDIAFGDVVGRGGKIKNLKGVKTAQEFANKKLSEMTLEEILKFQNERDSKNKGTSAVGKYQFMKKTLFGYDLKGGLVKQAGLSMNDKFSPENQEKLQEVFLGQNAAILKKSGVPTSPGYLYMAHYIGPYGAIAVYDSNEKGEDITVAQALTKKGYADPSKHNPELAKIKVSQLEEILSGRMAKGGATDGAVEARPEPQKEMPQIAAVNPEQPDSSEAAKPAGGGGGSLTSVFGLQPGVDVSKIHPEFAKAVVAMGEDFFQKTGKKLIITSGYRSNEKQKQLFDAKVAELGGNVQAARKMVAEPMAPLGRGRGSFHIKGLALDINSKGASSINMLAGSRSKSTGWLESFGLTRPVPGEDWHVQPLSTPPTPDNPGAPGTPIQVADKDGNSINLASGETKSKPSASKVPSSTETGSAIAQSSMSAKIEPKTKMKNLATPVQVATNGSKQNKTPSGSQRINSEGVLAEYRLMLGTA